MATSETVDDLRRMINQPDNEAPFTTDVLNARIDQARGDLRAVAAAIWTEKAATYAELTDVQEGSSRRALGDLYEQALKMAAQFGATTEDPAKPTFRRARVRQIVRP